MNVPMAAPIYFASMPASLPPPPPSPVAPPPLRRPPADVRLGSKVRAAAWMAALALAATQPASQKALRFVFGEAEVEGIAAKSALATAAALFAAALLLMRDL